VLVSDEYTLGIDRLNLLLANARVKRRLHLLEPFVEFCELGIRSLEQGGDAARLLDHCIYALAVNVGGAFGVRPWDKGNHREEAAAAKNFLSGKILALRA